MSIKKETYAILVAAILFGAAILFVVAAGGPQRADDSAATPEGIRAVQRANNEFALELYRKIAGDEEVKGENIFFSPYSISTAFAMTYEAVRGPTADEIRSVFGFPEDDEQRRSAMAALYNRLNPNAISHEMRTANALWIQEKFPVRSDFVDVIERFFVGAARNLDFRSDPDGARRIINGWVEKQTNGLIDDLFPEENTITRDTVAVLTNAVYFKGAWIIPFDEELTTNREFRIDEDNKVMVPMMRHEREEEFGFYQDADVQVLELPYKGDQVSMLAILPQNGDLASLEENLTLELIEKWSGGIARQDVHVFFPRFELSTNNRLNDYLRDMGIIHVFEGGDFSGLTYSPAGLYIRHVFHNAHISVDEKGTEAAAATGVEIASAFPSFIADRPFMIIIWENDGGNILFMGRVIDPTA